MGRLDGEQVAAHFRVPRHSLPVDVEAQRFWNADSIFRDAPHIIGKVRIFPMIAICHRDPRFLQLSEMGNEFRAQLPMLGYERRPVRHAVDTGIFCDADAFKALIAMNGSFLGIGHWRGSEHLGDFVIDRPCVLIDVDPFAMQEAVVVGRQTGDIASDFGFVLHFVSLGVWVAHATRCPSARLGEQTERMASRGTGCTQCNEGSWAEAIPKCARGKAPAFTFMR